MNYSFTKMHGLGNDFIVFKDDKITDYNKIAKSLCDRKCGIGSDGLLIVCDSDKADIKMRIINSDGSEAQMCGNGIRCFSKYVYEKGIVKKADFTVETLAGIMRPALCISDGEVKSVTVNMGKPDFDTSKMPMKNKGEFVMQNISAFEKSFCSTALLMGVPHLIIFDEINDKSDFERFGNALEHDELFPERTNVDFVRVIDSENIAVTTWERGCGLTLACGTGSCASVMACIKSGLTKNKVTVHLALGTLDIELLASGDVLMTGEASEVYTGVINIIP